MTANEAPNKFPFLLLAIIVTIHYATDLRGVHATPGRFLRTGRVESSDGGPATIIDKEEHLDGRRDQFNFYDDNGNSNLHAENDKLIQLDVLVQTEGEMGNLLGHAMTGYVLKWMMEDLNKMENKNDGAPNIELNVRFTAPKPSVQETSQRDLEICMPQVFYANHQSVLSEFPSRHRGDNQFYPYILQHVDEQVHLIRDLWNHHDNTVDRDVRSSIGTKTHISHEEAYRMFVLGSSSRHATKSRHEELWDLVKNLREVVRRMQKKHIPIVESNRSRSVTYNSTDGSGQHAILPPLSKPFLTTHVMSSLFAADLYYDRLRDLFKWEDHNPYCCHPYDAPSPDEVVLHARGFGLEALRKNHQTDKKELSPFRTATELLGDLKEGDKVAIISRFNATYMKPFTDALESRGLKARSVDEGSGSFLYQTKSPPGIDNDINDDKERSSTHDFCFLKQATKGVAGNYISTFIRWATILSDTIQSAKLYTFDDDTMHQQTRNITDIDLIPYYQSDGMKRHHLNIVHVKNFSPDEDVW